MSYPPAKKKRLGSGQSFVCAPHSTQVTLREMWKRKESDKEKSAIKHKDITGNFTEDVHSKSSSSHHRDGKGDATSQCSFSSSGSEDWWGGCPRKDISSGPSTTPVLPSLAPTEKHSVLFHPSLEVRNIPKPHPDHFQDVWDSNHVRMPCSQQSFYPVEMSQDNKGSLQCRWDLIKRALTRPIFNSHDLEKAIKTYNSLYSKQWKFDGLHAFFSKLSREKVSAFFTTTLPHLISLVLQLTTIVTHALPLLKKQCSYSISMSQHQVACLLANAFLCTFPRRNTSISSEFSSYPSINFNTLYSSDAPGNSISPSRFNKLLCICHYFARVTSVIPEGVITFERKVLRSSPSWESCNALVTKLHVDSRGTIECNGHGMIQVDFANRYVGGGVLGRGCVQEEIRFVICPELIVTRLFTEELDSNEVLEITGVEMFSTYRGYGYSFEWTGDYKDDAPRDRWGRRQIYVVAMDAVKYRSNSVQFRAGMLRRELNKAYCGFMTGDNEVTTSQRRMAVATGKWGCGVYGGDSRLKFLLQLIAAARAKRDVVFFTFGDKPLLRDICTFHSKLVASGCTVGDVWRVLLNFSGVQDLFKYLEDSLRITTTGATRGSTY